MRNRVLHSIPSIRFVSALAMLTVLTAFALAGCGGGGGGNPGPVITPPGGGTSNPGLATVRGQVIDEGGNGVAGVGVGIVGTALTATTDASGVFTVLNVPPASKGFYLTVPATYYNIVAFSESRRNYSVDPATCPGLPLPALTADTITSLPTVIRVYTRTAGGPPPSPPNPPFDNTTGCQINY